MSNPCTDDIEKAMGRKISEGESDAIYERLKRSADSTQAGLFPDDDMRLLKAAEQLGQEDLRQAYMRKRNAALNQVSELKFADYLAKNFKGKEALGIEAYLVGVNRIADGGRLSVNARQEAAKGKYLEGLSADISRKGLWQEFVSGELDDDISRELWNLSDPKGSPSVTKNKDARAIAESIFKYQEIARTDANNSGADIGKLSQYITRQSHDMYKIRAVTADAWTQFVLPLLDERTFTGSKDKAATLRNIYNEFASGNHLRIDDAASDAPFDIREIVNAGKKLSKSRVLFFKSADDWSKYNRQFGAGNLRESIVAQFSRLGDGVGLMRALGPNYQKTFDNVFQAALDKATASGDLKAAEKLSNSRKKFENMLAEMDGSTRIPGNRMVAKASAIVRGVQSMAKLGGALISSITDIGTAASELRYQGHGLFSSYYDSIVGMKTSLGKESTHRIASSLGVYLDGMRSDIGARFSFREDLPGKMHKAMQTFYKYNGLTWWTDRMRGNMALAMSHRLANDSKLAWGALDDELKRVFKQFSIGENDWPLIASAMEDVDGRGFVTPEKLRDIELSKFKDLTGKTSPTDRELMAARDDLEEKLRSYFIDRTQYAVIAPDSRTYALMRAGTRSGTFEGELLRFIMQFKAFPIAFTQKVLGRQWYGHEFDSLSQAVKAGKGDIAGLAHTIAYSAILGYAAMSMKDIIKGKNPRDPTDAKTWIAAMVQGGGAGIYGDYIFGVSNRFGRDALSTAAGPVIGSVNDLMEIWAYAREGVTSGSFKSTDFGAKSLNFVLQNTPFLNLFYTRWALDYLILYDIQEQLSPGYLRRMEQRVKKDNNQTYFVRPTENRLSAN